MKSPYPFALVTLMLLVAPTSQAIAWGHEAHAMVADIAEAHLTPAARHTVSRLLASEGNTHLDDLSSWADDYRSTHTGTGGWHYVNIPLDAPAFDPERDCKAGDCIVAKLVEYQKVLKANASPPQARLEALKWVVHLVGDIHQPLHVEDHVMNRPGIAGGPNS